MKRNNTSFNHSRRTLRLFQSFLAVGAMLCITGCGNNSENYDDDSSAKIIENSMTDPGAEYRQQRYSEQELERMRHNYELLIPYIKISQDSMSYILDISEQEAIKIGVDMEYYDMTLESVNVTNEALKAAFDNEIEVDMMDFKDLVSTAAN